MKSSRPAGRRSARRAGAALIIVVIVLLLLAIIGTAFVSTTQMDRVSAYQNAENTQIDLYLDGVVNLTKAMLVGELFGSGADSALSERPYRPANYNYRHYTSHTQSGSGLSILASRVIEPRTEGIIEGQPPRKNGPFDQFYWPHISSPMHLIDSQWEYGRQPLFSPMDGRHFYPYQVAARMVNWEGVDYPAFQLALKDNLSPAAYPDPYTVIAADADGDGVADAGLWPLEKQPRNGVSYFAAFRIIDNCAAINLNTAWRRDHDVNGKGANVANPALVPSNIGLYEFLSKTNRSAEFDAVNEHRFGGKAAPGTEVRDSNGSTRADYEWATQGVAAYYGLGARPGNPAYATSSNRYRAFGSLDGISLAYRYCMVNPEVPPSPLEQIFIKATGGWSGGADSLYKSAWNYRLDPADMPKEVSRIRNPDGTYQGDHLKLMQSWYDANFDYDSGSYNLRPLLVTSNPVSNAMPTIRVDFDGDGRLEEPINPGMLAYVSQGDWSSGRTYRDGDVVRHKDHYYTSVVSNNASEPSGTTVSNGEWHFQPWSPCPQKASLNTATFRELWRAYWHVMFTSIYNAYTTTPPKECSAQPLRRLPDAPAGLTESAAAQMRAAIAAVNTLGLREASDTVISRTITMFDGGPKHRITVFSNERQPVISEVLIHTWDKEGYIAVEIYNPYPDAISLQNWQLASLKREGSKVTITQIASISESGLTEIGGNEFIVLENHQDRRPGDVSPDGTTIEVPGLDQAFDSELVLMRPRRISGKPQSSSDPTNLYDEGTGTALRVADLAPIDQIDLTGIRSDWPNTPDLSVNVEKEKDRPKRGLRFRYTRNTKEEWRCFDPGEYIVNAGTIPPPAGAEPTAAQTDRTTLKPYDLKDPEEMNTWALDYSFPTRHEGLKAVTLIGLVPNEAQPEKPLYAYQDRENGLGRADSASYEKPRYVRLHDPEWTARAQLSTAKNSYPFGLFRRAGDVFLVPYISGYTIRGADSGAILEMNSLPMEVAMMRQAKTDPHLGRFVPNSSLDGRDDHWSLNILDYFCVRAPDDDYLPNYAADAYGIYNSNGDFKRYQEPWPVGNTDPAHRNVDEPATGVQGMVNVNTAPWIVLAQLPLVLKADGSVDQAKTIACAKDIASVGSLGRHLYICVTHLNHTLLKHQYGEDKANWPPISDFEAYYGPVIRLSELLTVRSDSFTVYVVVEGWRDAFTPLAKRVLQRRIAFVLDRSNITDYNREPRIISIPCN